MVNGNSSAGGIGDFIFKHCAPCAICGKLNVRKRNGERFYSSLCNPFLSCLLSFMQEYVHTLLRPIYESTQASSNNNNQALRDLIRRWSCYFEIDTCVREAETYMFDDDGVLQIDDRMTYRNLDYRETMMCEAVRTNTIVDSGSVEDILWKRFMKVSNRRDRVIALESLRTVACSSNVTIIHRLLTTLFSPRNMPMSVSYKEFQEVLERVLRHRIGADTAIELFLVNSTLLLPKDNRIKFHEVLKLIVKHVNDAHIRDKVG